MPQDQVPRLTRQWIDRLKHKCEHTYVAETASGMIVIAHPGQVPPDSKDRKTLRENFGLLDTVAVERLIDTAASPNFDRLYAQLDQQENSVSERKAQALAEYVGACLDEARTMGLPATPAIVREAEDDAAAAAARAVDRAAGGDPEGEDGEGRTVSTVGARGRTPANKDK